MSITSIYDAGLLRSLILIILPILGFWMLGTVLGWKGRDELFRERERERKREYAGRKQDCSVQQICN